MGINFKDNYKSNGILHKHISSSSNRVAIRSRVKLRPDNIAFLKSLGYKVATK